MSDSAVIYKTFLAPEDKTERTLWEKFLLEVVKCTLTQAKSESIQADQDWEPIWQEYKRKWLGYREPSLIVEKAKTLINKPETMASTS